MKISKVAKTVVAAVAAAAIALNALVSDGSLSVSDAVQIALAVAGVVGVYKVPNKSSDEK